MSSAGSVPASGRCGTPPKLPLTYASLCQRTYGAYPVYYEELTRGLYDWKDVEHVAPTILELEFEFARFLKSRQE